MSRWWSRRGGFAAVAGACLAFGERDATAAEPRPPLDLVYEAPPECPSRTELEAQLRARVPPSWLSRPDVRRFAVEIEREPDGRYSGRLDVRAASHEPDVREIRASTCKAVSTAIAVFLALALDPAAEDETLVPELPLPVSPRAPAQAHERRASSSASAVVPPTTTWTWSAGFHARHLRAIEAGWGARVHAEIGLRRPGASITPALRLSWGWSDFSVAAARAGEASFRLRTARLEACARIGRASSRFALAPCLALDVGSLSGAAPELHDARTDTTGWSAGGAVLRGSWSLADWLAIEVDATLLAPFERTRFVLQEPLRTVYRAPPVLLEGGLGACVSVRFH